MRSRVPRQGKRLAVRIPRPFADATNLREDSKVDTNLQSGKLVLGPVADSAPTLDDLVKRITSRNRHRETDAGTPRGNEVW
jgi:antitoxin component of MazEF toxin-antitoxin module